MLSVRKCISGDKQISNFNNACMSILNDTAVSIAVSPPENFKELSHAEMKVKMLKDFRHLLEMGYSIEIQIGQDTEDG